MYKKFLAIVLCLIAAPSYSDAIDPSSSAPRNSLDAIHPSYVDPFYYGFGISSVHAHLDDIQADSRTFDITAGYRLSDTFSLEGRAGYPIYRDAFSREIQLDEDVVGFESIFVETHYAGILGRVDFDTEDIDWGNIYGLFGVMDVTNQLVRGYFRNGFSDTSDTGIAYGFGIQPGGQQGFSLEFIKGAGNLDEVTWVRANFAFSFSL